MLLCYPNRETFIESLSPPPLPMTQPPRGYQYGGHQGSLSQNELSGISYNHGPTLRSEYRDPNSWIPHNNSIYNHGKCEID